MATITMFRLLDKKEDQNSAFENEDGRKDETRRQDFNNRYGVLNPYFILDKEGKREVRQYIKGCSFFDPIKQKLELYIPGVDNTIVEFKAGGDIILDNEDDAVLIKWLKDHPHNTRSKFHKPDKHDPLFFTYDPKEVQKELRDKATAEDEALELVLSLSKDTNRLRAVANLFEETVGMTDDTDMYLALREKAKEDPAKFTESIGNREKSVQGDIRLAMKLTVINKNAKGFYFEEGGAGIFDIVEKNESKSITEFAKYLMTKEAKESYKQILIKIDQKQIELNAPEGSLEDLEKKEKEPALT